MEREKIFNIILIILTILELIALIIFGLKYLSDFNFKEFMEKLNQKLNELDENDQDYLEAFEYLFHRYYDSTGLFAFANFLKSASVFGLTIILLILMILFQINYICKQKDSLRFILSIVFLIICFCLEYIYVLIALGAKYKIKLTEDEIYIFDDEFNKEIKKNLDFMYERRIYLIVCPFFAQFCFLCQIIMIIIKEKIIKKERIIIDKKQYFEKDIGVGIFEEMESR